MSIVELMTVNGRVIRSVAWTSGSPGAQEAAIRRLKRQAATLGYVVVKHVTKNASVTKYDG